jgi:hypothetical protein
MGVMIPFPVRCSASRKNLREGDEFHSREWSICGSEVKTIV